MLTFIDVSTRLGEPAIQRVLMPAVGYPTPEKLEALARQYASETMRSAFAFFDADTPVGVIALEKGAGGAARIQYIAVAPAQRCAGVGRRLIDEARHRESLDEVVAETHIDAVPFYRRCGFEVTSLGELWPGVERFECRWRTPERSSIVR